MIFNSVIVGSGGGGTGATVMAKAIGDTYLYEEGAKVILTPTTLVYGDTIARSAAMTNPEQLNYGLQVNSGGPLTRTSAYFNAKWNWNNPGDTIFSATFNEDLSNFTASTGIHTSSGTGIFLADYRDDNAVIGLRMNTSSYDFCEVQGMGTINRNTGAYSQAASASGLRLEGIKISYAGKHASCGRGLIVYDDAYNATYWRCPNSSDSYSNFATKFNGTWYGFWGYHYSGYKNVADIDTSTLTYEFDAGSYNIGNATPVIPLDDDWTYLLWYNNGSSRWEIVRLNKSTTAVWTLTSLTQPNEMLSSADYGTVNTRMTPCFKCKDYGDYVEIFFMSYYVQPLDTPTSEVAHFKFYKATETMKRLSDVFQGISGDWAAGTYCAGLQVNWQDKLIALATYTRTNTSPYYSNRIYVAKYDEDAGIYKYYAYLYDKENFYDGCMTGVVKENKGVNVIGDWILEVETVEDPDYIFDNSGVLYGMEVTVNPGI